MSTFNQQVPQPENGFQSLAEVFQRASRGQKRDAEKQGEETRKKFEWILNQKNLNPITNLV